MVNQSINGSPCSSLSFAKLLSFAEQGDAIAQNKLAICYKNWKDKNRNYSYMN